MKYLFLSQAFYPAINMTFSEDKVHYSVMQYPNDENPNNLLYITKVMFDMLKIDKREIEGVCIVYGPGSFTGTRIGVVDAKILAYSLGKPLFALNSLELIARHVKGEVSAILSASRNEYFEGTFIDGKRVSEDRIISKEELLSIKHKVVSFEDISHLGLTDFEVVYPTEKIIMETSLDKLKNGLNVKDPLSLKPLYLRAEDKLFRKMR